MTTLPPWISRSNGIFGTDASDIQAPQLFLIYLNFLSLCNKDPPKLSFYDACQLGK
jgi:hypothetical protein